MRFAFLLAPIAIVASAPAMAANFMDVGDTQAEIFPGAAFTQADVTLTKTQIEQIVKRTKIPVTNPQIKAWRVSTGGWFLLDQVLGRDDIVTYAIGLDDKGAIVGIEVLVCALNYDGVRNPRWMARFKGKTADSLAKLAADVGNVSGATLSTGHIVDGVKRMLVTHRVAIAPKSR